MDSRHSNEQLQRMQQAIIQVIDQQLQDNNPPETGATLDRLLSAGLSRSQAMDLIGRIVALEVAEVVRSGTPFDLQRYTDRLCNLPNLPELEASK